VLSLFFQAKVSLQTCLLVQL